MRTNSVISPSAAYTHEEANAVHINPIEQLRRSVMACMLFEDGFYEDGKSVAERIHDEVAAVLTLPEGAEIVGNIAFEARTKYKLRHAPLWLALALVRNQSAACRAVVSGVLHEIIQRPDELAEFLAMYWKDGRKPLSNQVKKGLACAFQKFDRYSLSKYANRPGKVKLRDVLFLVHAKPKDDAQAQLWKALSDNALTAPDTWESALSAGADKRETFTRLISEGSLGALAMLRNLRGMLEANVDDTVIRSGLAQMKTERVLPFRFISAARYAPKFEPELEAALYRCIEGLPKLLGRTALLVDGSGSMKERLSAKSEMTRWEAACALAILTREITAEGAIAVYSDRLAQAPPRRGFALRDAMTQVANWGGTYTGNAVRLLNQVGYDRLIVFTDEQSADSIPAALSGSRAYMVNVAGNRNGIGYRNGWTHIDGFSEAIIDYVVESEKQ